jgi:hypothetical protein
MIITEEQKGASKQMYKEAIHTLSDSGCRFMLGGAVAMFHYTGIFRDTKDLDIFCKPGEYPAILQHFAAKGYNNICRVDDSWYDYASEGIFEGFPVKFISAEELIWCKIYVQNRERNDSADINHILLKHGRQLDWQRLLARLDQHWHLLLAQILIFQFVYPADYQEIIPRWLFDDLMERAHMQYDLPPPLEKVCRGPMIDQTQYEPDIKEWNYKSYTIKTV